METRAAASGMKVRATVVYGKERKAIVIPCGDGRKTVKWLGLVAAQRFVLDAAAKGRTRHRDRRSVAPASSQLIPSGVSTEEEPFFHPGGLVCDNFEDGAEVEILLEPKVGVALNGQPKRSNWAVVAFSVSEATRHLRQAALDEEYRRREARLAKATREIKEKADLDNRQKGSAMRKMIASQLLQVETLEPAVEAAWTEMNKVGLMDTWVRNARDQDRVKRQLRDHYLALNELFKFYSAGSSGGTDAHQMEFPEFCAYARDVGVFGGGGFADHALLNVCFAEACEITPQQVKSSHMQLYQFLNAQVWLAQVANQAANDKAATAKKGPLAFAHADANQKRRTVLARRSGGAATGATSTAEMLRAFLEDHVGRALKKQATQLIGIVTKECLNLDSVLARFYEKHDALLGVYATYLPFKPPGQLAKMDLNEGHMTLQEFQILIEDATLLQNTGDHDELTLKEVRQAFAGAQTDVDSNGGGLAPKKKKADKAQTNKGGSHRDLNQVQLMSYAEFLEAILRLAMLKWEADEHDRDAVVEKLGQALDMIIAHSQNNNGNNTTTNANGDNAKQRDKNNRRGTRVGLGRGAPSFNARVAAV